MTRIHLVLWSLTDLISLILGMRMPYAVREVFELQDVQYLEL